jgi:hypothetical protein
MRIPLSKNLSPENSILIEETVKEAKHWQKNLSKSNLFSTQALIVYSIVICLGIPTGLATFSVFSNQQQQKIERVR